MTTDHITDEDLVAFLDGEADQALSARVAQALAEDPAMGDRLAALDFNSDHFRQGFDALLSAAPEIPVPAVPMAASSAKGFTWGRWQAAAAAVVLFAAGLGAGWSLAPGERSMGWHQAVADYQVLYSNATLTNSPMSADQRVATLAQTAEDLGLPLTLEQVSIEGLEFQRAQILEYQGQPLAQLTYLDGDGNPIAFCLTKNDADAPAAMEQISGMNAVTWAKGGMGFILIGPVASEALTNAQADLADQIKI